MKTKLTITSIVAVFMLTACDAVLTPSIENAASCEGNSKCVSGMCLADHCIAHSCSAGEDCNAKYACTAVYIKGASEQRCVERGVGEIGVACEKSVDCQNNICLNVAKDRAVCSIECDPAAENACGDGFFCAAGYCVADELIEQYSEDAPKEEEMTTISAHSGNADESGSDTPRKIVENP
jgi:hypothetical protein